MIAWCCSSTSAAGSWLAAPQQRIKEAPYFRSVVVPRRLPNSIDKPFRARLRRLRGNQARVSSSTRFAIWRERLRELQKTIAQKDETVAALQAENQLLTKQLLQEREASSIANGAESDAIEKAYSDSVNNSVANGHFHFPETDLPFPPEQIRLVGPGHQVHLRPCGDWLSVFRNAAPYIATFRGGTVVLHLPSFLFDEDNFDRERFKGIMEDVAFCSLLGLSIVLVASIEGRLRRRLYNADNRRGRRGKGNGSINSTSVTSVGNALPRGFHINEEILQIAKQEVGFARVEVEGALSAGFQKRSLSSAGGGGSPSTSAGIFPLRGAVSVVSSLNFFTAAPLGVRDGVDHGYAGVVRSVNVDLLERRLGDGDIVVLTPLGASSSGQVFFVSSESLAAQVGAKLQAIKLVYLTQGQRLVDARGGGHDDTEMPPIQGIQVHNAEALLHDLEDDCAVHHYPEDVRASEWFLGTLRYLRFLVAAVKNGGVRRGHLIDPEPGALLQEFYTTDGSGTCVAQDLYQGLGRASIADVGRIVALLEADDLRRGVVRSEENKRSAAGGALREAVETGCTGGAFFIWRRDEAVIGCGQLVPLAGEIYTELRHFVVAEEAKSAQTLALFGYAERAAIAGGAAWLAVVVDEDLSLPVAWFRERGFWKLHGANLPKRLADASMVLVKPLGAKAAAEAEQFVDAYREEQRMWGAVA